MEALTSPDLERTRAAFDAWRSSQPRRRRIPEHLWQMAATLLEHYPLSRVAHELRLSPKQLRWHKLAATRSLIAESESGLHFVRMHAGDFTTGPSTPRHDPDSLHRAAETKTRLIFERTDGSRLLLCLPASDWARIEELCTDFMHER